jgi:hypothetical protein
MAGRSRSHRRDTVARGQPEMSPAISWVMFVRIKVTTTATDLTARSPRGCRPGLATSPVAAAARAASSASCPRAGIARFSEPMRRWNSTGAGGSHRRS